MAESLRPHSTSPPLLTADTFTAAGSPYVIINLDKHNLGGFETSLKPYTLLANFLASSSGKPTSFPRLIRSRIAQQKVGLSCTYRLHMEGLEAPCYWEGEMKQGLA